MGLTGRVLFPGYVEDADLPALLSGALAFVFPSLYEGFGIPVLEAGACGVPVITSNTSSLPEVAGDAALLVDPHDVDAIAEAMSRLVTDEALRAELSRRGLANVKRFSWEKCARETLAVLLEAGGQTGNWQIAEEKSNASAGNTATRNPQPATITSGQLPEISFQRPASSSVRILGVHVDALTYADLLAHIAAYIAEGTPHQIATVNPEFVMEARRNPAFAAVLQQTDLCLADGVGLLWAARRMGQPLPERVTGSDGVPLIAQRAAERGWGFICWALGRASLSAPAKSCRDAIPGCASSAPTPARPPMPMRRDRRAHPGGAARHPVRGLRRAEAGFVDRPAGAALGVPVMMGVGGAFDLIAGVQKRAPRWVQRMNLEWFYRLVTQPWRWRRQLALPRFAWAVVKERGSW